MKLARWIFLIAGVFGLLVTVPLAFGERVLVVAQPEFYYGFVFLDICWQILYLVLSSDPLRYRMIMIPAFLAKGSGTVALMWLFLQGRISGQWVVVAAVDAMFAVLFLIAFWVSGREVSRST